MPFAPKYKNKDEQNKDMNISGSSSIINVPGGGGTAAPGAQKSQTSSGQYQNLQKYLNANQTQGSEMGQKLASDVDNQVSEAQQKVSNVTNVNKNEAYDPYQTINKINSGQILSDDEKKKYQTIKQTGGYTGPSSVYETQGYTDAKKASDAAVGKANQIGNELGQQGLLKQTYARPSYSSGENKLDQVLLMGSNQGRQAMNSLADKYKNLSSMFDNSYSSANDQIIQNINTANDNKAAFNPAETQSISNLMNPIQQRADQKNKDNPGIQDIVKKDLMDNSVDLNLLNELGLLPGQRMWNLNLNNYMTYDQTPMSANTVATQEERNKYKLLNDLFQTQGNEITENNPLPNYASYKLDSDKLKADLAAKENEFNNYAKSRTINSQFDNPFIAEFGIPIYLDPGKAFGNLNDYVNNGYNSIGSIFDMPWGNDSRQIGEAIQNGENAKRAIEAQFKADLENFGYNNVLKAAQSKK